MSRPSKLLDPSTDGARVSPHSSPRSGLVAGASRAGALAGLFGVVCYTVGVLLPGSAPQPDAATSQVMSYFVDQRGALLVGFALQLIALVFLLWFLGQLRTLVGSPGGTGVPAATAMSAAWVMVMTIVAVAMLPAMAIIWRGAAGTSPDLVRLAYDMDTLGTYALAATAALVSVAAPSLVIWRYRLLPRWVAVLGAFEVAANIAELAGLSSRRGGLAGGYIEGVGELGWVLWVAAASVCMALRFRSKRVVAS
jgi:hypothetical protein